MEEVSIDNVGRVLTYPRKLLPAMDTGLNITYVLLAASHAW